MKFCIGGFKKTFSTKHELRENRRSECHTLLKGVNDMSVLLVRFLYHSA
jgi:hypothetical protein